MREVLGCGNVTIIRCPLPNGAVRETLIDTEDARRVLQRDFKPYVHGGRIYWKDRLGYLHRFLLNAPKGLYVDHINHDTEDNRKTNLRLATPQQSAQNVRPHRTASTGFMNVTKTRYGYFRVRFMVGRKNINFGCFASLEEAAMVAERARREIHPYRDATAIINGGAA